MSSTAMKAPPPTPTFSHRAMASQGEELFEGSDTPLVHNFGSFHTYRVSWRETGGEFLWAGRGCTNRMKLISNSFRNISAPCYLDTSLACSLYLVVVALGAARTRAGAFPQEVERASITRSCRTGTAQTHKLIDYWWSVWRGKRVQAHSPGHREFAALRLLRVTAHSDDRTPTLITRGCCLGRPEGGQKKHTSGLRYRTSIMPCVSYSTCRRS